MKTTNAMPISADTQQLLKSFYHFLFIKLQVFFVIQTHDSLQKQDCVIPQALPQRTWKLRNDFAYFILRRDSN